MPSKQVLFAEPKETVTVTTTLKPLHTVVVLLKTLVTLPLILFRILHLRLVLTTDAKTQLPRRPRRSSMAPSGHQHWKSSSMGAVASARSVAKRWAHKIANKPASITKASGALWDLSKEPARQRAIEELTWQMHSLVPLTPAALEELEPVTRNELLGDRLFRLVGLIEDDRVGKVTGMLLELEDYELLEILSPRDPIVGANILCRWVAEAQGVLREAWLAEAPKAPPPSPARDGWTVVSRRRRRASRESNAEPQSDPAVPERSRPRVSLGELELKLMARALA